jgi:hypothetical protein
MATPRAISDASTVHHLHEQLEIHEIERHHRTVPAP